MDGRRGKNENENERKRTIRQDEINEIKPNEQRNKIDMNIDMNIDIDIGRTEQHRHRVNGNGWLIVSTSHLSHLITPMDWTIEKK